MKKIYFAMFVFCSFAIASLGIAQTVKIEATELFKQYRMQESNFSFESSMAKMEGKPNVCAFPILESCKPLDEMFRIQKAINVLSDEGDIDAMFYTALLKVEMAEKTGLTTKYGESQSEYELAAALYKRAGDGGAITGYWNVAGMYARGTGVIKSNSAAIEWFYKAGDAYMKNGLREKALASLDAIKEIDKEHRLGKRLQLALEKNESR